MHLRRPLAALTAASLAASGLALAGTAAAAPQSLDRSPTRVLDDVGLGDSWGMTTDAAGATYVTSYSGVAASVEVYAPGADGNDLPVRTITGPATRLDEPYRPYVAPNGLLYVADGDAGSVLVFAADADGDDAPLREITGAATGLVRPSSVNAGPGGIWVTDFETRDVSLFSPDADGDVAPIRTITLREEDLDNSADVAFSPDGSEMYVVDYADTLDYNRIVVVPAAASGTVVPTRTIGGDTIGPEWAGEIVTDSTGNLYVADYDGRAVLVYGPKANGEVEPHTVLTGPSTELFGPWNLVVNPDRSLVVGDWDDDTVLRFAPLGGYVAPAAPVVSVSGPNKAGARTVSWTSTRTADTGVVTYDVQVKRGADAVLTRTGLTSRSVSLPASQLRKGAHTVTVTAKGDRGSSTATTDFTMGKPGKVRALKVKGKAKAAKRTVRWKAPADKGGAVITKYRVLVKHGKQKVLTKKVKGTKRTLRLKTATMPLGKSTVRVQAQNRFGWSKAAKKRFTIRP